MNIKAKIIDNGPLHGTYVTILQFVTYGNLILAVTCDQYGQLGTCQLPQLNILDGEYMPY